LNEKSKIITVAGFTSVVVSIVFFVLIIAFMTMKGSNAPEVQVLIIVWASLGFIPIVVVYFALKKQISGNLERVSKLKQSFRKLVWIYGSIYFFVLISSFWFLWYRK
jgi:Na+/melibiose symporter-like transporter